MTTDSMAGLKQIRNDSRECGLVDDEGNVVVPFGKYDWIDSFDRGLARVKTKGNTTYTKNIACIWDLETDTLISGEEEVAAVAKNRAEHPECFCKWGVINTDGEEVIPAVHDEICDFKGKGYPSIVAMDGGRRTLFYFKDLPGSSLFCKQGVYSSGKRYDNDDNGYFNINDCYDPEGNFDYEKLEDAIMDGEYVQEDL